MPTKFDIGDEIALGTNPEGFQSLDGLPVDPTEVTVKHRDPNDVEVSEVYNGGAGNVVRDALGKYHLKLRPTVSGIWYWSIAGSESPHQTDVRSFEVRVSPFA